MATGKIHYEIHIKPAKGKWKMAGVMESRDAAIRHARELSGSGVAVQVTKETHQPQDGNYLSVCILREGMTNSWSRDPNAGKVDLVEALPCFQPGDLYSFESRQTIARLLRDSLARWRITPLELLHHPGHLERLESTGTVLQAAVQKVAVAQSQAGEGSVAERVKTLHKLISDTMKIVFVDHGKDKLPTFDKSDFTALTEQLDGHPRSEYLLNAAIAHELEQCESWDQKLSTVLQWITELPASETAKRHALNSIDGFVAEIMSASSAVKDVLGQQETLGNAIALLVRLFSGQLADGTQFGEGVLALNRYLATDRLPQSKMAIAGRILTELESNQRLAPKSIDDELIITKKIGAQITIASNNFLPQEQVLDAFRERTKRFLVPETLEQILAGAENPAHRAGKLIMLSEHLVGNANRQQLAKILIGMITEHAFDGYFTSDATPVSERLRQLSALQEKVFQSEIDSAAKREAAERFDYLCTGIMASHKLLEKMIRSQPSAHDKALSLLKLAASDMLTRGKARETTQRQALSYLREPGVLNEYLGGNGNQAESRKKELSILLQQAGIDPHTVLGQSAAA